MYHKINSSSNSVRNLEYSKWSSLEDLISELHEASLQQLHRIQDTSEPPSCHTEMATNLSFSAYSLATFVRSTISSVFAPEHKTDGIISNEGRTGKILYLLHPQQMRWWIYYKIWSSQGKHKLLCCQCRYLASSTCLSSHLPVKP